MNKMVRLSTLLFFSLLFTANAANAQFTLTGEIRPVRNSDMVSKAFFPKKPMRRFSSSNAPACT